jgi:hypothetical protein
MTKIAIVPNAAGTGTFTIEAPNSNSNRTLVLPDSAGTVATAESTLAQFNATGSAPVYACRAWVNFDGTLNFPGTIRASGNVSSVTRNGTGDYTVNFTTAMPDANYAPVGLCGRDGINGLVQVVGYPDSSGGFAVGSYRFYTVSSNAFSSGAGIGGNNLDVVFVNISIFR